MNFPLTAREVVVGVAGLAAGLAAGIAIAHVVEKRKYEDALDDIVEQSKNEPCKMPEPEEDEDEALERVKAKVEAAKADDQQYQEYVDLVKKANAIVDENRGEPDDDEEEPEPEVMPDGTHVYQDGDYDVEIKQEPPKKHKKPKVLGAEKTDPDDPSTDYKAENIYYFMRSEVLTDKWGHVINETDTIGPNPRRFGFMNGQGKADTIWIRNYDRERDYLLHRKDGITSDFFGSNGPGDEDEEESIE